MYTHSTESRTKTMNFVTGLGALGLVDARAILPPNMEQKELAKRQHGEGARTTHSTPPIIIIVTTTIASTELRMERIGIDGPTTETDNCATSSLFVSFRKCLFVSNESVAVRYIVIK